MEFVHDNFQKKNRNLLLSNFAMFCNKETKVNYFIFAIS